jgi:hypothetical protein
MRHRSRPADPGRARVDPVNKTQALARVRLSPRWPGREHGRCGDAGAVLPAPDRALVLRPDFDRDRPNIAAEAILEVNREGVVRMHNRPAVSACR